MTGRPTGTSLVKTRVSGLKTRGGGGPDTNNDLLDYVLVQPYRALSLIWTRDPIPRRKVVGKYELSVPCVSGRHRSSEGLLP